MSKHRSAKLTALLLGLVPLSLAAETNVPPPFVIEGLPGTDKLSEKQKVMLAQNGFVILPGDHRQIFDVYLQSPAPYYITADSVIQAFSVVLEDCIRKQERASADDLLESLKKIQTATDELFTNLAARAKEDDVDAKAFRESLLFLSGLAATAGQLMDPSFPVKPQVRDTVDAELKLIHASEGVARSPLSGRLLDYARFKAVGKYAGDPVSIGFYRCVRFLQDIKFHVESEKETLAGMILDIYCDFGGFSRHRSTGFGSYYSDVFGKTDDLDSSDYRTALFYGRSGEFLRENLGKTDPVRLVRHVKPTQENLRKLPPPRINDEALQPEEFRDWQNRAKGLRLVCPSYLPDSELIFRSVWPSLPTRQFPSGLDIGVLLGSRRAVDLLAAAESPAVAGHVQAWAKRVTRDDGALYPSFLRLLEEYRGEMEANRNIQAVFRQPAWDDKMLNSLLCGWSLVRHTACLAGKDSVTWYCALSHDFAGYVEPVPRFYMAMADLLCCFEKTLCARGEPSLRIHAMEIADFNRKIKASGTNDIPTFVDRNSQYFDIADTLWPGFRHLRGPDWAKDLEHYAAVAERVISGKPNTAEQNAHIGEERKAGADGVVWVTNSMSELQGLSDEEILRRTLQRRVERFEEYRLLIHLCVKLASIALKETQNIPLSAEDTQYIKHYGGILGNVCFYGGNSYMHSRDDMPVAVPVFSNLEFHKVLMAGIGRAKCMKIVIRDPQTGKDMVCSGGITLYHEHTGGRRLSDQEWRATLLQPDGPKPAPWIERHMAPSEPKPTEK
jgi:hypothetical protein